MNTKKFERNEYPRPQFRRKEWIPLNGEWEFEKDISGTGEQHGFANCNVALKDKINVPFCFQYEASGIGNAEKCDTVWYRRSFYIENTDKNALLCFNGADYVTDVYINGKHALTHTGGYAPFTKDITQYIVKGENVIVVKCFDAYDEALPRGKQSWTNEKFGCWYIPSTGIWQSVWIEFFEKDCINAYSIVPDIDNCLISGEIETLYGIADAFEITIEKDGKEVVTQKLSLKGKTCKYVVEVANRSTHGKIDCWSPEHPALYYATMRLYSKGNVIDSAQTRFGMRKFSISRDGKFCLNNHPYYQRLILDQGYWKESGTTPPSVAALKKDIELCKAMGFNGARKHQKLEDPYWYYLADELGFLTWCEMPSAYDFCEREILAYVKEWADIVAAAKNFTSVAAYVPLNESWGVRQILTDKRQQNLGHAMYYTAKAIDGTRPISTNDGWENTDATDFITIHDYSYDDSEFEEKYVKGDLNELNPVGRKLLVEGATYKGQPVLFDEFGGVAMRSNSGGENWGYGESANSNEEFYARLEKLVKGVYRCPFQGFCYTQVSDVQQEVNGLLDENHIPKFDVDRLKKIFENKE